MGNQITEEVRQACMTELQILLSKSELTKDGEFEYVRTEIINNRFNELAQKPDTPAEAGLRELDRLIGWYPPSIQASMKEQWLALFEHEASRRETALEPPTLQEVIAAGMFPTPSEYEKMIWMFNWCRAAALTKASEERSERC